MRDSLGDRMKALEADFEGRLIPHIPAMVRLDGRAFHNFTKKFRRPIDHDFRNAMVALTKEMVDFTSASIGYTQSDEITLILYQSTPDSQLMFGGRVQKLCSVLAGHASAWFNKNFHASPDLVSSAHLPVFDCRVWSVPNQTEAANALLWREQDATKNSIQMAARSVFSHSQVDGKVGSELQEMLFQKGINWNDYPAFFKRGTYVQKVYSYRTLTPEELSFLPEKHESRLNPSKLVERGEVKVLDMPIFNHVLNREDVIFKGSTPLVSGPQKD